MEQSLLVKHFSLFISDRTLQSASSYWQAVYAELSSDSSCVAHNLICAEIKLVDYYQRMNTAVGIRKSQVSELFAATVESHAHVGRQRTLAFNKLQ